MSCSDEEEGEERAYVADFGVARAAFSGADLRQGTWSERSATHRPSKSAANRSTPGRDVYALGCLLYECLTGRVPFARRDSLATPGRTSTTRSAAEPAVPDLPLGLDAVVAVRSRRTLEARFGSAGELAEAALDAVDGRQRVREPTSL